MVKAYLQANLGASFRESPFRAPLKAWAVVPFYAVSALAIGFGSGLFHFKFVSTALAPLLPFTLLIFPSMLEEAFFRGVLIPRDTMEHGRRRIIPALIGSTALFVLWHPLSALTINRSAIPIFLDPAFLCIVAALGLTCGYSYLVSKSIWAPIIIHWATVVVWVFFLGGRNLVLEL